MARSMVTRVSMPMRVILVSIAGTIILFVSLTLLHTPIIRSVSLLNAQNETKLHLLVPVNSGAGQGSPKFCKTLVSAFVHGYQPIILNWDVEGDRGFMQHMKVYGTVQKSSSLPPGAPFDLI